jgi:hypothetical protein
MKIFVTLLFTSLFFATTAQKTKIPNSSELVLECMKTKGEFPSKQMVIWFPVDFWRIVGTQMKVSPEFMNNFVDKMGNYMMFAVVDYSMSSGAKISFKSDEEIRKSIKLIDSANNFYFPLTDTEISEEANRMVEAMKPTMSSLLGQFGEGMRLFLFQAKKDKAGSNIINIARDNNFSLKWDKVNVNWKLPFASVLESKFCPVDNEEMKGNWNYCPIHGKKLD